jgi:hypothetical protein
MRVLVLGRRAMLARRSPVHKALAISRNGAACTKEEIDGMWMMKWILEQLPSQCKYEDPPGFVKWQKDAVLLCR